MKVLFRRSWVVLAAVLLVVVAAFSVEKSRGASYTAEAQLVVPAGLPPPGHADEASRLAVTFAALIPADDKLIRYTSARFGVTPRFIRSHVSIATEGTTALLRLRFRAPRPDVAIRAARTMSLALTGPRPISSNFPRGSLQVVHLPAVATPSKGVTGLIPLSAVFGLFLGIVFLIALERADPRVDDEETLAVEAACPAWPLKALDGETKIALLQRWSRIAGGEPARILLVAASRRLNGAVDAVARRLEAAQNGHRLLSVDTASLFSGSANGIAKVGEADLVVLTVMQGAKVADLRKTLERLRDFGGQPGWALLVTPGDVARLERGPAKPLQPNRQ